MKWLCIPLPAAMVVTILAFLAPFVLPLSSNSNGGKCAATYSEARSVRARMGHEAAMPLYQSLINENRNDLTAGTRLASGSCTNQRHDKACPLDTKKIQQLRQMLCTFNYDNEHIQQLLGVQNTGLQRASGPVYVKPAIAGDSSSPLRPGSDTSPLECLVTLFLLGIAVPAKLLIAATGKDNVDLLEQLGLAFPCETDPQYIVPYVHLFPINVVPQTHLGDDLKRTLLLVTDLHPRVLSTTTVGTNNHGTVMYIGPDSLALVQHLPLHQYIEHIKPLVDHPIRVLDFCSGSGVQALFVLFALKETQPHATAVCVDCNERALQFTLFNAELNGLKRNQVTVLSGDLIAGVTLEKDGTQSAIVDALLLQRNNEGGTLAAPFDIVLANPPFIPVPPNDRDIEQRYGLFSSGGADGEDVLKSIVDISSQVIQRSDGLLGIVSEFMNPPQIDTDTNSPEIDDNGALLRRLQCWWSQSHSLHDDPDGVGVLLTNQFAVEDVKYARRRADTQLEFDKWLRHMSDLTITHVSPGLLFVRTKNTHVKEPLVVSRKGSRVGKPFLSHRLVPKSEQGSIWTPSNVDAVTFTKQALTGIAFWK